MMPEPVIAIRIYGNKLRFSGNDPLRSNYKPIHFIRRNA